MGEGLELAGGRHAEVSHAAPDREVSCLLIQSDQGDLHPAIFLPLTLPLVSPS